MIKKQKKYFSLLFLSLCILLSGCVNQMSEEDSRLRIGAVTFASDDTFINSVMQNFEKNVRELEMELGIKINLTTLGSESNQTLQNEQIDRFIEQEVDVLLVNIVDRTAASVIIDKAKEADIPLVFFNRQPVNEDVNRWEKVYYIGAKAEESGQIQGEYVRELWQSEDENIDKNNDNIMQYIMLEGEVKHQDTLLRTQYAIRAFLTTNIKVEKLADKNANWNRSEAMSIMTEIIGEFGDEIEVVFANNDDMALGAIDAYKALEIENMPIIVGIDGTIQAKESILNEELDGTVLYDSEGIAKAMLEIALFYYNGTEISYEIDDEHYIWLPHSLITLENIH